MFKSVKVVLIFLSLLALNCEDVVDCSKILGFFPIAYLSHQSHHFGLFKALADRGHHLTIFTTHLFDYDNSNVTQIHLNESVGLNKQIVNQHHYTKKNILSMAYSELNLYFQMTNHHLENQQIQKLIANGRKHDFDLIIVECYLYHPLMALAEVFDCPIIVSTALEMPFPMMEMIGNELKPTIHPERVIFPWIDGKLTLTQKLYSTIVYYAFNLFALPSLEIVNSYLSHKHLRGISSSYSRKNVENRIAMVFSNYLTTLRPILPNTVLLNFLHVNPPKALPENDVKKFLDGADNGFIMMSLGSYAESKDLDPTIISSLIKTFETLPYRILWKYEGELGNLSCNVMIVNWLPQADILAHPNLKLFITHGGMMSTQEAIDREIPMLIVPLTYDQPANAASMVQRGVAVKLDLNEINEISLKRSIDEITKPIYKSKIRELKRVMNDKPMSDRERGVWSVEYVIRNKGAQHLQSETRSVSFYQKQQIDVILFILIIIYITFKIMKSALKSFQSFGLLLSHHSMEAKKAMKIE